MTAYIVVPVIVLTVMAIWFLVYMYDKRFKNPLSSSRPATTCPNVRQEGIVYTISNPNPSHSTNANGGTPDSRIDPADVRMAPPQYGYTNQHLLVVTSVPRDLPPSYDQVTGSTAAASNNVPST